MAMYLLATASAAFGPSPAVMPAPTGVVSSRRAVAPRMQDSLAQFLETKAGVSSKFLPTVLATCDSEMIGSVSNLVTLAEAGMLSTVFKPVIAASIESALDGAAAGGSTATAGESSFVSLLPLADIKRLLVAAGRDTWGTEAWLRNEAAMLQQETQQSLAAQWDSKSQTWSSIAALTSEKGSRPAGYVVPGPPANFNGGQWAPLTPDGDLTMECPPDEMMLDAADELDNADDFADLPYACRAGSCSACAGKIVSGTVDVSGCSFLSDDQKADGWVLTCSCKPTSDCVIKTHMEEDMF